MIDEFGRHWKELDVKTIGPNIVYAYVMDFPDEPVKNMIDEFGKYMNEPVRSNCYGYTETDANGTMWIRCPYCGKKNLKITEHTRIEALELQCKGSKCKGVFKVKI